MSGILKLIEKQRAMWDIKDRLGDEIPKVGRWLEAGVGYGPCLLISRECGSGGDAVARLAGQRLGWQVYNREIVDQVAELAHARQKLVESVDERVRTRWEEAWRQVLFPEDIGADTYFHYLRQVILTLGHHGDVVVLGRGAQHFLPPQCALRVRLVAPIEARAKRTAELRQIDIHQAQDHVRRRDEDRATFIRKYFHCDASSPLNYDVVINTAEVGYEKAAEMILASLEQKLGVMSVT